VTDRCSHLRDMAATDSSGGAMIRTVAVAISTLCLTSRAHKRRCGQQARCYRIGRERAGFWREIMADFEKTIKGKSRHDEGCDSLTNT